MKTLLLNFLFHKASGLIAPTAGAIVGALCHFMMVHWHLTLEPESQAWLIGTITVGATALLNSIMSYYKTGKWTDVQAALGVVPDGVPGPVTMAVATASAKAADRLASDSGPIRFSRPSPIASLGKGLE